MLWGHIAALGGCELPKTAKLFCYFLGGFAREAAPPLCALRTHFDHHQGVVQRRIRNLSLRCDGRSEKRGRNGTAPDLLSPCLSARRSVVQERTQSRARTRRRPPARGGESRTASQVVQKTAVHSRSVGRISRRHFAWVLAATCLDDAPTRSRRPEEPPAAASHRGSR